METDRVVEVAVDADFRRACEIFEYDPEEVMENPDLFAEIAEFLMTTEVMS